MKICFYILFVFTFFSCTTNIKEIHPRYKNFSHEEALRSQVIYLDTILFRYPFRIAVRDSFAIILDLHNADHFLHAFTFPEWRHIVSFGRRGNGPEEILSAETVQFNSSDSLWVLDANKMQITRWSIQASNRSAHRVEEIPLDKYLIRTLDFEEIADGFIVPDYSGEYRYHKLNRKGEIIQSAGHIPTENGLVHSSPALAQAWRSFIDYNPDKQILSLATQLGEVIEIIDLANDRDTIKYGPNGEPVFNDAGGEGIPTGIMGFSDIQITDNYIYTVFHGRSFKEIERNAMEGIEREDGGRYIYVFDFQGNPVIKYTLDRAIYGIHVDEDNNIIYATDVNSDEPIVQIKFDRIN